MMMVLSGRLVEIQLLGCYSVAVSSFVARNEFVNPANGCTWLQKTLSG